MSLTPSAPSGAHALAPERGRTARRMPACASACVDKDPSAHDGGILHERQTQRLPQASRRAAEKMQGLAHDAAAQPLIHAAQRAATVTQRVVWLQRAASAWARPLEAVSACRVGCAHCCHIPVAISSREADLIARASARVVSQPERPVRVAELTDPERVVEATDRLQASGTLTPCPFLVDARCTVYEARPLVCRVLLNLDDDDLLCRHSGVAQAEVPYADSRQLRALALAAQPAEMLADIRDFFPTPPPA
jgi:Fe-S-cluster containining protein